MPWQFPIFQFSFFHYAQQIQAEIWVYRKMKLNIGDLYKYMLLSGPRSLPPCWISVCVCVSFAWWHLQSWIVLLIPARHVGGERRGQKGQCVTASMSHQHISTQQQLGAQQTWTMTAVAETQWGGEICLHYSVRARLKGIKMIKLLLLFHNSILHSYSMR